MSNVSNSITSRLRAHIALKLTLMVVLNAVTFGPYHYFQFHHLFPATVMQPCFLDRALPFLSWTVIIYLSIYLLMPIGPFLMQNRTQILRYSAGVVIIGFMADIVFLFWPTVCERPEAGDANLVYEFLIRYDMPFHAFPSLHAAFAIYSALCGVMILREMQMQWVWQSALWFWAVAILLATLTTKQHVFVDLVAGTVLGAAAFIAVFRPRIVVLRSKPIGAVTAQSSQLVN